MSNDAFAARGQGAADWLADHPMDDLALLRPYVDPDHQQEFDALIEALRTCAPQDDREAEENVIDVERLARALERELAYDLGWPYWDDQIPNGDRWLRLAARLAVKEGSDGG